MDRPKLIIDFPTDEHRDDFLAWLCDGGGEYIYMEGQTITQDTGLPEIVEFDYSDCFKAWGYDGKSTPTVHCYQEKQVEDR
jgi:hypothetical protein